MEQTIHQRALELKRQQDKVFNRTGIFIGIGSGFLWGVNNLLFSLGYAAIPEEMLVSLMGANAALFLIPLACAAINDTFAAIALTIFNCSRGMGQEIIRTAKTKPGLIVMLAALFGGPIAQSSYFIGSALAGPEYALTITALYPIIGCILARIFLKQEINLRMWIGICFSVIGAVVVSYAPPSGDAAPHFTVGLMFAGVAACCWGIEIVMAAFGMAMVDPYIAINIREITSGVVLSCLVVPLIGAIPVVGVIAQTTEAISFLLLAGIAAGFSYLCWYTANNKAGCAKGMATNSTFIVWGVLLNILFGNITEITVNTVAGCLLVFLGVLMVSMNPLDFFRKGE